MGYKLGNGFTQLRIFDDFQFIKEATGRLKLTNFAGSSYQDLDIGALWIENFQIAVISGDRFYLGNAGKAPAFYTYTTAQRNALAPVAGMIIFNTDTTTFQIYNGTRWEDLVTSGETETAMPGGDATPDTGLRSDHWLGNMAPQDITDFDNYYEGQIIRIRFTTGSTTLKQGAALKLSGGGDLTPAQDTMVVLIVRSDIWYQIGGVI